MRLGNWSLGGNKVLSIYPFLDDNQPQLHAQIVKMHDNEHSRVELYQQLENAIQRLPHLSRIVCRMAYIKGRSTKEITEEIGLPKTSVRDKIKLGIKILRNDAELLEYFKKMADQID